MIRRKWQHRYENERGFESKSMELGRKIHAQLEEHLTKGTRPTCPECLEECDGLEVFEEEIVCSECAEHLRIDQEAIDTLGEEVLSEYD